MASGNGKKTGKLSQSEAAKLAMEGAEVGEIVPLPNGVGALRKGNPGNKGGGRPSNAFKLRMQKLMEETKKRGKGKGKPLWEPYLQECLEGKHGSSAFKSALEFASDRAYGKVPNVSEIRGGDEPLRIIVEHGVRQDG